MILLLKKYLLSQSSFLKYRKTQSTHNSTHKIPVIYLYYIIRCVCKCMYVCAYMYICIMYRFLNTVSNANE